MTMKNKATKASGRNGKARDFTKAARHDASQHTNGSSRSAVVLPWRAERINGTDFLITRTGQRVDRRTYAARRFEALVEAYEADLGGEPSTAEAQLIRRAAMLGVELDYQEAEAIEKNQPLDADIYRALASTQRQILQAIGLKRQARDVTPTLQQIISGSARCSGNGGAP